MKTVIFESANSRLLSLTLSLLISWPIAVTADDGCDVSGEYAFVCGPKNAEDLVLVPDTNWIISSGMAADGAIYLVNSDQKTWVELYPADEAPVLTWKGCIMTPDGMEANSVASFDDGSLLATIPLHTGISMSDALAGKSTGGVYQWSPGAPSR